MGLTFSSIMAVLLKMWRIMWMYKAS